MYNLSAQLLGHTADIRAITHTSDDAIVSTSRDVTSRVWKRTDTSPCDYEERQTLQGHSRYIIAVCALPKEFAEVIQTFAHGDMIATGSNDNIINLYALDTTETLLNPIFAFKGHTDTVCCLNYHRGALLSSSWDGTCRVWKGANSFVELKGHTTTVWYIVGVPGTNYLLSASGDRTIRLWDMEGVCRLSYEGHQDAVRSILPIDDTSFLSAANDSLIIQWNIHSRQRIKSFMGHESLIYQLYPLPMKEGFVSVGEDKSLKVWSYEDTVPKETIRHPAISVWCVTVLSNGDIATGSSDGVIRVFSKDGDRKAPASVLEIYNEMCQSSASMDKIDPKELPGLQALATPGKFNHENRLVNNQGLAEVYQWNEKDGKWSNMGEAMGSSIGGTGPKTEHVSAVSNKTMLDGEEFDQVIDVDVKEGMKPFKLGFNYNDDPWMVGQKFIWKHGLSQLFLDQISLFIAENQKNSGLSTNVSSFSDPYSGSNRYIPGTSGNPSNNAPSPAQSDPYSGGGRYIPGSSSSSFPAVSPVNTYITIPPDPPITRFSGYAPAALSSLPPPPVSSHPRHIPTNLPAHYTRKARHTPNNPLPPVPTSTGDNKYFPKRDLQLFTAKDPNKIMEKLTEFNSDNSISADAVSDINTILTIREFDCHKLYSLVIPLCWPPDKFFIALDIIRIAMLDPSGNRYYAEEEGEGLLHFVLYSLPSGGETACKYLWMGINILNNLFAYRPGQYLMEHTYDQVIPRLIQLLHEHPIAKVQIGISTVCLNYSVIATCIKNEQLYSLCGRLIRDLLSNSKSEEAQFRTLVAFGHLTTLAPEEMTNLITNDGIVAVIQSLVAVDGIPKISECADLLQALLISKQK
ncbi:Phospholipase A-2-activating protein [Oopsacas minuta]|uniref:Phospholipase A-2-activating protein n=1 Tax=Oopsacas minuta TaxID=111878 RepID=A0AAV7JD79_9METZ|nr:Phospholipase A-2-activating protein [Oopsacas minuta]